MLVHYIYVSVACAWVLRSLKWAPYCDFDDLEEKLNVSHSRAQRGSPECASIFASSSRVSQPNPPLFGGSLCLNLRYNKRWREPGRHQSSPVCERGRVCLCFLRPFSLFLYLVSTGGVWRWSIYPVLVYVTVLHAFVAKVPVSNVCVRGVAFSFEARRNPFPVVVFASHSQECRPLFGWDFVFSCDQMWVPSSWRNVFVSPVAQLTAIGNQTFVTRPKRGKKTNKKLKKIKRNGWREWLTPAASMSHALLLSVQSIKHQQHNQQHHFYGKQTTT